MRRERIKKIYWGILNGLRFFFKRWYWLFFGYPTILRISMKTPAVNNMHVEKTFQYKWDSFYPTLYTSNPRRIKRIYSKVNSFDERGLPIMNNSECKYWPVTIAQFGLLNYNYYLTYSKDEYYKEKVLTASDWLLNNLTENGVWEYGMEVFLDVVDEKVKAPFVSAMAQGEGISLLVRAYSITGDNRYIECAEKAMAPFYKNTTAGGVLEYIGDLPIYEEYPTETPSHVLNGFIFSLFGLYDLSCTTSKASEEAKRLFQSGYDTLVEILPLFDGGFCSRYDLGHITAPPRNWNKRPFYHYIHVNQLIAINSIQKSDILSYYVDEWK